ncbi:MAG: hypothetical protein WDM76_05810 [Limisphaerales bacterium]
MNPAYPGLTPFDEIYYAAYSQFNFDGAPLAMNYYFADFGVFFYSTNLSTLSATDIPLAPPNPGDFQQSYFQIFVLSDSGIASLRGNIDSVTVVSEPTGVMLLLLGIPVILGCNFRFIKSGNRSSPVRLGSTLD